MATKSRKAPDPKKPTPTKAPAARLPVKTGPVKKVPAAKTLSSKPISSKPVRVTKPVAIKPKVVQNFTVTSPPAQRKNEPDEAAVSPPVPRERKMTRTLDPSESFLANLNLINSSRLNVGPSEAIRAVSPTDVRPPLVVAKPVSFEIPLEVKPASLPPAELAVDDYYDDDFESYESDFEECPTSEEEEDEEVSLSLTVSSVTPPASSSKSSSSSHRPPPVVEFKITGPASSDQCQTRGQAILSKITLDDLTYSLLELPPMAITFGHSQSSMQVHCQTDSRVVDKMVETETFGRSTKWTQTQVTEAVGEVLEEGAKSTLSGDDIFAMSLNLCAKAHQKYGNSRFVERTGVDSPKLERFLRRGYFVIKQLQNSRNRFSQPSSLPFGQGKATLQLEDFLKSSKLTLMTVSDGTLVTVHEHPDAKSFISLWDLSGCYQLACCVSWTAINCVALANLHTLIAGSVTGSLVLWDPLDCVEAQSQIVPSQILHLSDDFLTNYGIVSRIRCSKSPRLKIHCLHDNNYLTVWILLRSSVIETVNTAIICDLGYIAPNCQQRLTYVSGVGLNTGDHNSVPAKTRFSKVLHCFDNDILQDQVLQKLITNETPVTSPTDGNRRYLVTDMLVDGKTVALVTDRNFLFNGFSTSSSKKTKVWLGRGKMDTNGSCSVDSNGLLVTGNNGLAAVEFQANGQIVEKHLHSSMDRLVRSSSIQQTNGSFMFRIVDQELKCVTKDGRTLYSMKNCVNFQIWRESATKILLVLQLANGQIEVHQCDLIEN